MEDNGFNQQHTEDDDTGILTLNKLNLISRSTTPGSGYLMPRHEQSVIGNSELPRTRGARRSNYARIDDLYKSLLNDTELLE